MKDMLLTLKKIANSVLALLIVVSNFNFVPSVQAVGEPTLTIGSQSASNGATINVPINASNFTDVGGIDITVQFDDTKLTYINTTLNNLPTSAFTNLVGNQIKITWDDFSNPLNIVDGNLVTLNFTVIASTTSDTNLTFVGTKEINGSSGNQISASFVGGVISLNPDTTAPVITLLGNAIVNLVVGDVYTDAGATASDNIDGNITANIIDTASSVNTAVIGTYTVTYNVSDAAGNAASQVSRTVFVSGGSVGISLTGAPEITLTVGDTYTELGATASDEIDGPLAVQITGSVDTAVIGDYTITYTATDADSNTVTVSRTIHVVAATVPVTIPGIGGGAISQVTDHSYNVSWNWPGASDVHFSLKQSTGGAQLSEVTQIGAVVGQTDYTYTFDQLAPNTGYLFSVETVDNIGGNSGFGNTNPTITLASVPHKAQAVADSPTQITVSWGGNATTYAVSHRIAEFNGMNADVITNLTSQQFTDLTCNTEYTFSISARNSAGFDSASSALVNASTQACPPPVPAPGGGGSSGGGGDTTIPVITLLGDATVNLLIGDVYADAGATASDNIDGDITANIATMGLPINTATPGIFTITYSVSDAAGNAAIQVTRTILVAEASANVAEPSDLTALGVALNIAQGKHDAAVEGNLPGQYPAPLKANLLSAITTAATVTSLSAQSVVDAAVATLNDAVVTFEAGVVPPDTASPVITLLGNTTVNLTVGDTYTDAGATAADNVDGDITANIVTINPVNTTVAGTYTVTYNVSDAAGNAAVAITRTVIVSEVVVPPVVIAPPRGGGGGSAIVVLSSPSSVGSTASQTFPVAALAPIVPTVIARTVTPQVLGVRVFSENVLLRVDQRSIYIVRGRTLHSIPNAEVLRRFASRDRLDVTAEDIAGYEIGNPVPTTQPTYVARTLLRVNAHDIYVVTGRMLNRVPNPRTLWPYRDFTRMEVAEDALIEFTIGETVPAL